MRECDERGKGFKRERAMYERGERAKSNLKQARRGGRGVQGVE